MTGRLPSHAASTRASDSERTLLVQEPASKKAPRCSVVKVEVAVGTEVLARKKLPVRFGDQSDELLVRELLELFWCDGSPNAKLDGFHGSNPPRHLARLCLYNKSHWTTEFAGCEQGAGRRGQ
jgi:hypothetical protein